MINWIKSILPFSFAASALVIIFSGVMIFHVIALLGIIPGDILWGGRITSPSELFVFELISLIINTMMLITICIKAKWWNLPVSKITIQMILWLMVAIFLINTIGNLMALKNLETLMFTPLTAILSILCFRMVAE